MIGTLPKPHIPSAVPMFTGREDEIKEISNLIADDSTRLVNIWGSPGFGKTSIAIEVAHHLSSLGYAAYFFKLQGITTIHELLSKILSIFRNNLLDVDLKPVDKLVSIFREISSPVILLLDNVDDVLAKETRSAELFVEFLDSSTNINIIFTTRALLENLRDQVKGFQDVRIRPLSPVSSVKFVRQLLPLFSENVVAKVAKISFHVPLAIRLVASLIKNSSEEMAIRVLEELHSPDNFLEHFEKNMQKLFDKPFEQLASADKHALISLTVFTSSTISKDAAIDVVAGEQRILWNALQSLDTLVKKSLIDQDPNGKYYSIHPLIYTFVVLKAELSDFQNVLNSAKVLFCRYYLLCFERLNDDFLAGRSIDNPQLQDVMQHISTVMWQSLLNDSESAQHVFRILSKAEIFLFLIRIPSNACDDGILKLFDFAIEKSLSECNELTQLKLYVSKYFQTIAFSLCLACRNLHVPNIIRKKIDHLSDGTAAKLSCYEGILYLCNGRVQNGIKQIEMSLGSLQNCLDQLLLKCLCLQVLTLYYCNQNELDKSCEFRKIAIETSKLIGNCDLFLIAQCDSSFSDFPEKDADEPLVLFSYLLARWSHALWGNETKSYVCNFIAKRQLQKGVEAYGFNYSHQVLCYGDALLAFLSILSGQETFLDKQIEFLSKSIEGSSSLSDNTISNMSQKTPNVHRWSERLYICYSWKGGLTNRKDQSTDACRKALDLSLQQNGEKSLYTAACYLNIGIVENAVSNYSSALNALDQALDIILALNVCKLDYFEYVGDILFQKGLTHHGLGNFKLAILSFEEVLDLKRKREISEESETIANILFWLGVSHSALKDFTSALATLKRSLFIRVKLFSEQRCDHRIVVLTYKIVASVHHMLNNDTEKQKCLEEALEMLNGIECKEDCLFDKCLIYLEFIQLDLDVNFYVELLDRSVRSLDVVVDNPFLPIFYLTVALKQLESGKYEAGIASLQAALDVDLDVSLQGSPELRHDTVSCYLQMLNTLVKMKKCKFFIEIINKALQLAESLPKHLQSSSLFFCYYWKGVVHNRKREFSYAIQFLENALTKLSEEANDKLTELQCQQEITVAYYNEGRYKDALKSQYDALCIINYIYPDGSEKEAESFHIAAVIAQKLGNKKLMMSNLRFRYKMYSKVLGQNHQKTHASYLEFVYALLR